MKQSKSVCYVFCLSFCNLALFKYSLALILSSILSCISFATCNASLGTYLSLINFLSGFKWNRSKSFTSTLISSNCNFHSFVMQSSFTFSLVNTDIILSMFLSIRDCFAFFTNPFFSILVFVFVRKNFL